VRRIVVRLLVGAGLLLVARSAMGIGADGVLERIYYVGSPQITAATAAARLGLDGVALPAEVVALPRDVALAVVFPAQPAAAQLAAAVAPLQERSGDWVVLVRSDGAVIAAPVDQAGLVLRSLARLTGADINDSTWGKIKEIFQ
jgi:hypothetical protein